ncbi:MAG: DUF4445 domain-containing protein [Clostridia bacterium]|nr:DUF4445 domain-containing protein [Clostridia bacterium]
MKDFIEITLDGISKKVKPNTLISDILPKDTDHFFCGGKGICKKCVVFAKGELSPLTKAEEDAFDKSDLEMGKRLSCLTRILGFAEIKTQKQGSDKICSQTIFPKYQKENQFQNYGVAIDIGTTTLAMQIYGRDELLCELTAKNPQARFGADVMTRIHAAISGKAEEITLSIREGLSDLISEGAKKANIPLDLIDKISIAGNTAMLYFLTGQNVECLSRAPFIADRLFGETVSFEKLSLPTKNAEVYLSPCISSFVGGDITMAILSSDIKEEIALLSDIGTNGEIVLKKGDILTCCSTAAGPAFEGAGLSMGMNGKEGAIDHVFIKDGKISCHVIGDTEPIGICGSGVIDAIACLLEKELLDETGYLEDDEVILSGNVYLNGSDIRMIQLAKGAVRAGMETLMEVSNLSSSQIERLYIAGGFGSYINEENAKKIGLIIPCENISFLGNAALCGAAMILLSKDGRKKAEEIAKKAKTIELSDNPIFSEKYMEAMIF